MYNIVYHGSENGNIKELTPHRSTHKLSCIYATPDKVVSLLFMGKGNGDLDTVIGEHNGMLEIVERRPGVLTSLYNKGGYLYELDGTTFNHYDYLWSKEVISFSESIKPLKVIFIPNILEEINKEEKKGNIKIYKYPTRPECIPLDNSDLIEKYIRFENSGLTGAIDDLLRIYPEFSDVVNEKLKSHNANKSI